MKRILPPAFVIIAMVLVYVIMHGYFGYKGLLNPGNKDIVASGLPDHTGQRIVLTYVQWPGAIASVQVVKAVLHNKMGFHVAIKPVAASLMWKAVADGSADGFLAAWLPTIHAAYYKQYKDKLVDLGPNLKGTKNGLVVPDYVKLTSITQLNKHAKEFGNRIIGIDPGAGIMNATRKAVKQYHLKLKLVPSSSAAMTALLNSAIKQKKPIVVTGWQPFWIFARWDLHYLKDPKNVYGHGGDIYTFVRLDLKKDKPDAYYVLNHFHWTLKDLGEIMNWNTQKGSTPAATAQRWIKENPKKVKAWLPYKNKSAGQE